jgi:two-component system phosphate regulon sensor histidine kinase PhoR
VISKVFKAVFISTLLFLVIGLSSALWLAHSLMMKNDEHMLYEYTEALVKDVDQFSKYYIMGLDYGAFRVTLINADGSVFYDSKAKAHSMPNHKDRSEFIEAMKNGSSSVERFSETLDTETVYYAVKLKSGEILRASFTTENVFSLTWSLFWCFLGIVGVCAMISAYIAYRLSLSIVRPINAIDLNRPLDNVPYEELGPLVRRIDMYQKRIKDLIDKISKQSREMQAITASMSEGLVLFNALGVIISINDSAKNIFKIDDSVVGKNILSLDRSAMIRKYFDKGEDLNNKIEDLELDDHFYRIFFNKIDTDDSHVGYALLVIDVTQKRIAERQRQEFTANVSHELKTPLQSIIGRAELLENNLVNPKDIVPFAKRIRKEGENLLNLINDIILLSRLDEGKRLEDEQIDIGHVLAGIKESLEDKCRDMQVSLSIKGEAPRIYGVFRYFNQMLFNLCDNAIKYNNPGGHVWVDYFHDDDNIYINVKDDGIGIPKSSQMRIFERFYCVDKSHNKARVGTGLGLSIVKHIVLLYGGKIEVDSEEGVGTTFKIVFPQKKLCQSLLEEAN